MEVFHREIWLMDWKNMTFTVVSILSPWTLKIYGGATQISQQTVPISAAGLQGEESLVVRIMYVSVVGKLDP